MRARDFLVDILEESTNDMRLLLEEHRPVFESLSGWDEINAVLDNIEGETPLVGNMYSALSLTFIPPGKMLIIKGHTVPLELIKITTSPYVAYTFKTTNRLIVYPESVDAGEISHRSFLFSDVHDSDKTMTFISLKLENWHISNKLVRE